MYTKEPGSIASSMGPNKETWERRRVWAIELLLTNNCHGFTPAQVVENAKKLVEYVWPDAMSWGKEPVPPPVSTMVLSTDIKGGAGGPGGAAK